MVMHEEPLDAACGLILGLGVAAVCWALIVVVLVFVV
jgi:hypothetical protein